jgi:hypothetical protein
VSMCPVVQNNVIQFKRPRRPGSQALEHKQLLESVYASQFMPVGAEDHTTKRIAALLQVLGFLNIHAVTAENVFEPLRPSQAIMADDHRPWRLTKPALEMDEFRSLYE